MTFDFLVNMNTAQALGFTFPGVCATNLW